MILNVLATTPTMLQGTLLGLMAAAIFTVALLLVHLFPRRQWLIASFIIIAITPLAIGGFWFSSGALGVSDWDYYFSYHHFLRESILHHHTFPLWNPYTCGGTAALADPEFPVISVTFPLELIFGVETGFRLAIFLSVAVGALGMLAVGKRLKLSVWGALVAALTLAFGSVNLLEIVEGHQNILSVMWLPWIFWSWHLAYTRLAQNKPWLSYSALLCPIFLALTFYAGGIYLLMYTAIAFVGLIIVSRDRRAAIIVTITSSLLAIGLAAFKLIPVFLWLSQFQDQAYASSALTLPYMYNILLGRYLYGLENIIPNQGGGWHEYGAYVGPVVLVLALLGALMQPKQRVVKILLSGAVIALLISSTGPYLKPFFDQASFLPRSNISRFILLAVIPLGLLSGFGLDSISQMGRKKILSHGILVLIAIDLMTLSYPLSQQAFVLPRHEKPVPPAPSPIAYTANEYKTRYQGVDYTRAYEAVTAGYGSLSYCAVLGPNPAVRTIHDEIDNDILSVKTTAGAFGTYQLKLWNPNMVVASLNLPQPGTAVLNANYAKGWLANGQPAKEIGGRVGTPLPGGTTEVTFRYQSPGLVPGITISLLTIAAVGAGAIMNRKRLG